MESFQQSKEEINTLQQSVETNDAQTQRDEFLEASKASVDSTISQIEGAVSGGLIDERRGISCLQDLHGFLKQGIDRANGIKDTDRLGEEERREADDSFSTLHTDFRRQLSQIESRIASSQILQSPTVTQLTEEIVSHIENTDPLPPGMITLEQRFGTNLVLDLGTSATKEELEAQLRQIEAGFNARKDVVVGNGATQFEFDNDPQLLKLKAQYDHVTKTLSAKNMMEEQSLSPELVQQKIEQGTEYLLSRIAPEYKDLLGQISQIKYEAGMGSSQAHASADDFSITLNMEVVMAGADDPAKLDAMLGTLHHELAHVKHYMLLYKEAVEVQNGTRKPEDTFNARLDAIQGELPTILKCPVGEAEALTFVDKWPPELLSKYKQFRELRVSLTPDDIKAIEGIDVGDQKQVLSLPDHCRSFLQVQSSITDGEWKKITNIILSTDILLQMDFSVPMGQNSMICQIY